jgi:adenosyl cobinamide kinase/adenosyl cobinamide phosphate guanylyltransferase
MPAGTPDLAILVVLVGRHTGRSVIPGEVYGRPWRDTVTTVLVVCAALAVRVGRVAALANPDRA